MIFPNSSVSVAKDVCGQYPQSKIDVFLGKKGLLPEKEKENNARFMGH